MKARMKGGFLVGIYWTQIMTLVVLGVARNAFIWDGYKVAGFVTKVYFSGGTRLYNSLGQRSWGPLTSSASGNFRISICAVSCIFIFVHIPHHGGEAFWLIHSISECNSKKFNGHISFPLSEHLYRRPLAPSIDDLDP
ncbi:hypothetical protein L1049_018047 [Liquidambar formosana]|uniref:Uncharacterized protein n=1 Tax=Liquidambar formosana TaxID=63359 RepID=A0AAP0R865_LIQFO